MKLADLVTRHGLLRHGILPDVDVRGITTDARDVRPGDLFVAVEEGAAEGRPTIRDAVLRGAIAVVTEREVDPGCGVPVLVAQDARRALALLSDRFFGAPSRQLRVAAVTGTNAKSSVAMLISAALKGAGLNTQIMETIRHAGGRAPRIPGTLAQGPARIHAQLRAMVDEGYRACAMEVSSHALVQGHVEGVRFDCGVFTNLSRDHLDFHGTYEEYIDAKAELFRLLGSDAVAVINHDDPAGEIMAAETRARVVTYGISKGGDVRGEILRLDPSGMVVRVVTPAGTQELTTRLVGRHQASNLLAAIAAALSLGLDLDTACRALTRVRRLPGRMERLPLRVPYSVYVDYAHNEAALRETLSALRPLASGRLIAVFGCGGDRYRGKRARMARVAECCADEVIVTQDNPRTENPASILSDIIDGFRSLERVDVEPDRRAAIRLALDRARPGDVVLVAGKGPETEQEIGDFVYHFDDRLEIIDHLLQEPAA